MEHEQSPLRREEPLTLELFDHYVARARAERAKAIAEFFSYFAASLYRIAVRLAGMRALLARTAPPERGSSDNPRPHRSVS